MLMKCCDLCGAENQENDNTCLRCGFEFPMAIRSDIRDEAILKKHEGKCVEKVKIDLKNRHVQLRSYLENIEARSLTKEDLVSLLDESLAFLQVPLVMKVEDELKFNQNEKEFITIMADTVEKLDIDNRGPTATAGTYVKLTNALMFMEKTKRARDMLDKALLINPNNLDVQYGKAKLLFSIKDYEAAKKVLKKIKEKGEYVPADLLLELILQIGVEALT